MAFAVKPASLACCPGDDPGLGLELAAPAQTAFVFHAIQAEPRPLATATAIVNPVDNPDLAADLIIVDHYIPPAGSNDPPA